MLLELNKVEYYSWLSVHNLVLEQNLMQASEHLSLKDP